MAAVYPPTSADDSRPGLQDATGTIILPEQSARVPGHPDALLHSPDTRFPASDIGEHAMTRRSIDQEELARFREALRDSQIQRTHHDRADTGKSSGPDQNTLRARREAATQPDSTTLTSRTSDGRVEPVAPSQFLSFALADLPERTLARLRRGDIAWQAGLDLHGYDLDQARLEFEHFMQDMRHEQARCVLIVHGKAWSGVSRYPVIKSHLNAWLRELPEVLAFCSAQDADGGTGAVYVLLKRQRDHA